MKTRYSAIAPDGSVHTRTSARTYTHAVLADWHDGNGWGVWGFSGSLALAVKTRDQAVRQTGRARSCFVVVEVQS